MNHRIPHFLRPFAAIFFVCTTTALIGITSVGILMGIYYGLVDQLLSDDTHRSANTVIIVIGGTFAACFGLFLGFRIMQTGSLSVNVLIPSGNSVEGNKRSATQDPVAADMERRVMAGGFSRESLQRYYFEEGRYKDYEDSLKDEWHAATGKLGLPPPLMHLRLARIYLAALSSSVRGEGIMIYDDIPKRAMVHDLGYSIETLKGFATFHLDKSYEEKYEGEREIGRKAANELSVEAFQEYDKERESARQQGCAPTDCFPARAYDDWKRR